MASSNAANAIQGNRPRPSTVRPIVPAIPLPYIQKRKQRTPAPPKSDEVPPPEASADTPKPMSPLIADILPATANGNTDATERAEVEAELSPVTLATEEVGESVDASFNELQHTIVEDSRGEYCCRMHFFHFSHLELCH